MKILKKSLFLFLGAAISSMTYAGGSLQNPCVALNGIWAGVFAGKALDLVIHNYSISQNGSAFNGTGYLKGFNLFHRYAPMRGSCTATGNHVKLSIGLCMYRHCEKGTVANVRIDYKYNSPGPNIIQGYGTVSSPGFPLSGRVALILAIPK